MSTVSVMLPVRSHSMLYSGMMRLIALARRCGILVLRFLMRYRVRGSGRPIMRARAAAEMFCSSRISAMRSQPCCSLDMMFMGESVVGISGSSIS